MEKDEIIEMLKHYFEVDLDNCVMTHDMWIEEVAKALTDGEYLKKIRIEYKEYLDQRSA